MNPDNLRQFIDDHRADFDTEAPPTGLWDRIEAATDPADDDNEACDPLRAFIVAHREDFDNATPPPQRFGGLHVSHRRRNVSYLLGIAASLLLLLATYHFGNRAGYRAGQDRQVAQQLEAIDPELAETERFYQQKIATEFAKVTQVNDDPQLRLDLKDLDAATAQLRSELLEVPASQRPVLVNELIEAYRTKLDILLRIQQHFSPPITPTGTPGHRLQENKS